jgi:ribonuclease PH
MLAAHPLTDHCAAVSVGVVGGDLLLDLDYEEDAGADVDLNVVMTGRGGLVEVQGTAEGRPFTREQLSTLLDLAARGVDGLVAAQRRALGT